MNPVAIAIVVAVASMTGAAAAASLPEIQGDTVLARTLTFALVATVVTGVGMLVLLSVNLLSLVL